MNEIVQSEYIHAVGTSAKGMATEYSAIDQLQTALLEQYYYPQPKISLFYLAAKRTLDIFVALLGLSVIGLFLPLIALFIILEDRGPLFYRHIRLGKYGRPFTTYKFRSMFTNADEHLRQNPQLWEEWKRNGKIENDPRITRVGRFLRRTSIDELPQLFNVLCGEVSLVGPRAIQHSEVEHFGELFDLRQRVKPGLTGLWQVSGRSMIDYEQRIVLDCIYVLERSFWMDLLILLKTIPVVLNGIGAY